MRGCPNCLSTAIIEEQQGKVTYIYCEDCGHKTSNIDHGKASKAEMKQQRRKYQQKYEAKVKRAERITNSKEVPKNKIAKAYRRG